MRAADIIFPERQSRAAESKKSAMTARLANPIPIETVVKAFELEENCKVDVDFSIGHAGGEGLWNFYMNNNEILLVDQYDPAFRDLCIKHALLNKDNDENSQ